MALLVIVILAPVVVIIFVIALIFRIMAYMRRTAIQRQQGAQGNIGNEQNNNDDNDQPALNRRERRALKLLAEREKQLEKTNKLNPELQFSLVRSNPFKLVECVVCFEAFRPADKVRQT